MTGAILPLPLESALICKVFSHRRQWRRSDQRLLKVLSGDFELNAQGRGVWLDAQAACAAVVRIPRRAENSSFSVAWTLTCRERFGILSAPLH
jgi:hypothetical protein